MRWDGKRGTWLAEVGPGEYAVHKGDEIIMSALLGSCISACIFDREAGVGGMNHFMTPLGVEREGYRSSAYRYGVFAMERMINEILKNGGVRRNLKSKVFGGADLCCSEAKIGALNVEFVKRYLYDEGIPLLADDTGGDLARRLLFYPGSGRVLLKKVKGDKLLHQEENGYLRRVLRKPRRGEVELF